MAGIPLCMPRSLIYHLISVHDAFPLESGLLRPAYSIQPCVFSPHFICHVFFFFIFSLFRGEKRDDLGVRRKASRHVAETMTSRSETEHMKPAHTKPSTPDESEAVHLASSKKHPPMGCTRNCSISAHVGRRINSTSNRPQYRGCSPCLHNEQTRT